MTSIGIVGDIKATAYLHRPIWQRRRRVWDIELIRSWTLPNGCTRGQCWHGLHFELRGLIKEGEGFRRVHAPVEIDWEINEGDSLDVIAERMEKSISKALDVLESIAILENGYAFPKDEDFD